MRYFNVFAVFFVTLGFASAAQAEWIKVKTIELCQQEDGDQWVEIGIIKNTDQSLEAIVVEHDADEPGKLELLLKKTVTRAWKRTTVEYSDSVTGLVNLVVRSSRNPRADLALQVSNPRNPFMPRVWRNWSDLHCYGPSEISYPIQR